MRRPRPPPLRTQDQGRPRQKSLRAFDFDANLAIYPAVINTLATCDWVKKGLPLCLIGDSGTGKFHLLIALGTEASRGRVPRPLRFTFLLGGNDGEFLLGNDPAYPSLVRSWWHGGCRR